MRINGNIRIEIRQGGGLNQYGEPIAPAISWSEKMPCLISTNSDTRLGKYEDGEFRQASFSVLTEGRLESNPTRISLERHGEDLGEFRPLRIEWLPVVNRTQILV